MAAELINLIRHLKKNNVKEYNELRAAQMKSATNCDVCINTVGFILFIY